jgi:Leucine-rich repeat (LRR) protein
VNLKILRVSNNNLRTFPESIGRLVQLRQLEADGNQLQTLPDSTGKQLEPELDLES